MATAFDWRVGVLDRKPLYRVQVFHGARPLADRQAWRRRRGRRKRAVRGRSPSTRRRRAVIEVADAGGEPDRLRPLRRRSQGDGARRLRRRGQRQPEHRCRRRGRGPEGRALPRRARLELVRRLEKRMQPGRNRGGEASPVLDGAAGRAEPPRRACPFDPPARAGGGIGRVNRLRSVLSWSRPSSSAGMARVSPAVFAGSSSAPRHLSASRVAETLESCDALAYTRRVRE